MNKNIKSFKLGSTKKIHFVGIGGIGMSGIAEFLHNKGFEITGSDLQLSDVTDHLEKEGIVIYKGHNISHLENVDLVVKSSAVKDDNPEVSFALRNKINVIRRAEMLAELMRMTIGIGIAGTHGKSTSSSMTGMVLTAANLDPTVIVGGKVMNFEKNNRLGSGEYMVVEADEYDRSFLTLSPIIAAITNIEADHLDCYENLDDIKQAFITFANKVPFYGCVVLCIDDIGVQHIMPYIEKKMITYGFSNQADVRAINIKVDGFKTIFEVLFKNYVQGVIEINSIGKHNILNSLLAVAVGIEMNIPFEKISLGLRDFKGVYRRCELICEINNIKIFDDYAHHPTEISATLSGLKDHFKKRIVAVFQPHLYSRTRDFADDFGKSFEKADVLILAPIFPAREKEIPNVSSKLIADAAIKNGIKNVFCLDKNEDIVSKIKEIVEEGDILITIGAGDINKYGKMFIEGLK